jgi:hypothetical protein
MPQGSCRLLIHVGYPLASSAWLQKSVLTAALGFRRLWPDGVLSADEFILPLSYTFDAQRVRTLLESELEDIARMNHVPVLSDERLCGGLSPWGYEGELVARRLHAVVPQAKVLICVREQRSWLLRLYQRVIRQGGIDSLEGFINKLTTQIEPLASIPVARDYLKYDGLVGCYQQLFGRDNVLVLPVEQSEANCAEFINRILQFVDLPALGCYRSSDSSGVFMRELAFRRKLNRWSYHCGGRTDMGQYVLDKAARLAQQLTFEEVAQGDLRRAMSELNDSVRGYYDASNARLQKSVSIDITSYGYSL